ncbi:MAG TPA: hypothetical protein VFS14_03215 [Candidatus Saccharimonadales bacterium]|nr:hypothetical protein [Candidatus Saccharimonadales bacterium]
MVHVLFTLNVLATVGTLLIPMVADTRGRAIYGWASNFLGGGATLYLIHTFYPSWQEPAWHHSLVWVLIAWAFLIAGLIIAIRKPRKQNVPATR